MTQTWIIKTGCDTIFILQAPFEVYEKSAHRYIAELISTNCITQDDSTKNHARYHSIITFYTYDWMARS